MNNAPIAMTMGDPAGIGPELLLRAWLAREAIGAPFFALADPDALAELARALGLAVPIAVVDPREALDAFENALPVAPLVNAAGARAGQPRSDFAAATVESIERAVGCVRSGAARAIVTNPISKKTLYEAGFAYPGIPNISANSRNPGRAGAARDDDMVAAARRRSRDDPYSSRRGPRPTDARPRVSTARIVVRDMRRRFGIARPRLALAGLNPHAGEGGALGREEIETIAPAIAELTAEGLDVAGPLPADTMFHPAARARYDVALTMYHDQGLIPAKTLAFDDGVNVTLGLPFVRTSPDHGTAFDIAGKGLANPSSLIAAARLAARLSG